MMSRFGPPSKKLPYVYNKWSLQGPVTPKTQVDCERQRVKWKIDFWLDEISAYTGVFGQSKDMQTNSRTIRNRIPKFCSMHFTLLITKVRSSSLTNFQSFS